MRSAGCRAGGAHAIRLRARSLSAPQNVPCTNAGLGSNLTRDATVECDASAMAGDGSYGAVGAVAGIRNPIRGAVAVLQESKRTHPAGLVAPTCAPARMGEARGQGDGGAREEGGEGERRGRGRGGGTGDAGTHLRGGVGACGARVRGRLRAWACAAHGCVGAWAHACMDT